MPRTAQFGYADDAKETNEEEEEEEEEMKHRIFINNDLFYCNSNTRDSLRRYLR